MENKINIAELLKDCPKGTKLYSPLVGECTLEHIHCELKKILISTSDGTTLTFNNNGTYFQIGNSECLLFPSKDQRDWSKFQRPFKDGDVVTWEDRGSLVACIYKERKNIATFNHHIALYKYGWGITVNGEIALTNDELCFASEEEKAQLFQAIKDNGYKWDTETKTLGKLPKFKVGDRIILKDNPHNIPSIRIKAVTKSQYILENEGFFYIDSTDEKYVLEDKFDINTLVPFESRVLVRDNKLQKWSPTIWGFYDFDSQDYQYKIVGGIARYCIPYEGNEHLLGTTNDCDNYYKNWE